MASEILQRNPTSTGNRQVHTWSSWVKLNKNSSSSNTIYYCASSGSNEFKIQIANGKISTNDYSASAYQYAYNTDRLLKDYGNWFHLMLAVDTTQTREDDRFKIYVNGVLYSGSYDVENTNGGQNYLTRANTPGNICTIGQNTAGGAAYDANCQLTDVFMVDGQALTPDVFGFNKDGDGYISVGSTQATDFRPGQWVPKSPRTIKTEINRRGGFGVNGFYLPMNDSSNFGADFHTTPNSIITLKGEDLPQPRNGAPTTTDAYVSQLRSDPYAANLVLAVPGISTATGVNQIVNGTFDSGTSNWTAQTGATLTNPNGVMRITATSTAGATQVVSGLTVGKRYTLSYRVRGDGTNFSNLSFNFNGTYSYVGNKTSTDWEQVNYSITATHSIVTISPYKATSGWAEFDDFIFRQEDAPRDYSADIKGSGTNKTLTPNGAAGVGYEIPGYYGSAMTFDGSGDYFDAGSSSDFDFGSGDFTIEYWQNANGFGSNPGLGIWDNANNQRSWLIYQNSSALPRFYVSTDGTTSVAINASSPTIPTNQWTHFCMERSGSTLFGYVNGVCVGSNSNLGTQSIFTPADPFWIGRWTSYYINGHIQDFRVYKGVAKYKGGFDVPKPYTPVGIETWRQVPDTCKNNFATWNSLSNSSGTLSEGNLSLVGNDASGGATRTNATIAVSSGKWYFEVLLQQAGAATDVGIAYNDITNNAPGVTNGGSGDYGYLLESANTYNNNSSSSYGSSLTTGDIFMCAFDVDTHKLYFGKNGIWFGSSNPVTGSNPAFSITSGFSYRPVARPWANGSANAKIQTNFGQNPTFGGTKTAGTYTDSNGKGLFKYAPPTGFLALCEDNLPTPAIANPGEHFKTVLYTGTGSSRAVTGVGFKPDFVWIKNRDSAYQHQVYDSVRGAGQKLLPSTTNAETTDTANVSSFDSNGFSFAGGNVGVNQDTKNHVAWCWKAGGAPVANTDGALTSQVSVNQDAGFSIATYTTPGTATNFGHGLGKKPAFALFKARNDTGNWAVYHQSLGTNTIRLSTNDAQDTSADAFNNTAPTKTLMYLGTWAGTNNPNINWVSYLWAEIPGYSKFSTYQGTGQSDGPFVYCGFKPAWVMVKCSSNGSTNWRIWDSSRGSNNPTNLDLLANTNDIENSYSSDEIDLLSNGFKIRSTGSWHNLSGGSFIFMAFAESPFQTANAK